MIRYFPFDRQWLNMKTIDNKTPIDVAAEYGHLDFVKECLNDPMMGLDHNQAVNSFILAAAQQHGDQDLRRFASTKRNVLYELYWVCHQDQGHELLSDSKIARSLLTEETLQHQYKEDGFTPLMIAVKYQQVEGVKNILDSSFCDKNVFDKYSHNFKRTVLHICADIRNSTITDLLLDKVVNIGVNVTPVDIMGNTPLHICVKVNNIYMSDKLLELDQQYSDLKPVSIPQESRPKIV